MTEAEIAALTMSMDELLAELEAARLTEEELDEFVRASREALRELSEATAS